MTTINPYVLDNLFEPWVGGADIDEDVDRFESVDVSREADARMIIERDALPHMAGLSPSVVHHSRLVLQYYLSCAKCPMGRHLASLLVPFEVSDDGRVFALALWQALFPGEDYALPSVASFRIEEDVSGRIPQSAP